MHSWEKVKAPRTSLSLHLTDTCSGLLVVVQAFVIMWTYFDIDALPVHVHAIRRHWWTASIWIISHLPLSGAFILASSTLTDLVLAHDCASSNADDLADAYKSRSVEELEQPMRW